jgi:hypothetical protein
MSIEPFPLAQLLGVNTAWLYLGVIALLLIAGGAARIVEARSARTGGEGGSGALELLFWLVFGWMG